jgi:hypothetical protein
MYSIYNVIEMDRAYTTEDDFSFQVYVYIYIVKRIIHFINSNSSNFNSKNKHLYNNVFRQT